jgi:hypothetical protein
VNVDEPGCQRLTVARDGDERFALGAVADDGNPAVGYRDVGDERRGSASIVDARVPENCLQQRLA